MSVKQQLSEIGEDFKFYIQRDGLWGSLPVILQETMRLPCRHLNFFVLAYPLTGPLPNFSTKLPLAIRLFEETDLEWVRKINRPSEARQCARHLKSGHTGLAAYCQGQLAGYAWGSAEINPEIEKVPLSLEPGDVLCTDVFTNPVFRGKGVQTALSLARFEMFRNLGFTRAICYIEVNNAPSLAVWQRKFNSIQIGAIDFLRIGGWYRVRFSKIIPQPETNHQRSALNTHQKPSEH